MSKEKTDMSQDDFFKTMQAEYRLELLEFYSPFFTTKDELNKFVDLAFNYDDSNSKVRFMIQQVQRFVMLANDIEKIRPSRDPLRLFFLKTCMDALRHIVDNSGNYKKVFYVEFENCFSEEAEKYILSHFEYTGIVRPETHSIEDCIKYAEYECQKLSMSSFLRLIKAVRDTVAHEGNYWSMVFFNDKDDCPYCTDFRTDEKIFGIGGGEEITYNFHANLKYDRFVYYFVEACINFIVIKGNLPFSKTNE